MKCNIDWQKVNKQIVIKHAIDNEHYLFSSQLNKIISLCDSIIKEKEDKEKNGKDKREHMESMIGVIGERGGGKSSFLYTIKENLKQDYYVLEVIDPSAFDDSMSILELYISQIYKGVLDIYYKNGEMSSRAEQVIKQVKNIVKLLSDSRDEKNFYVNHAYNDILETIKDRVDLSNLVKNLSDDFLKVLNEQNDIKKYRGIVLCIDDVDLVSNNKIYKLLEEVRKYLAGNIIVIASYRAMQLFDAVLSQKTTENELLLKNNAVTQDQVRDQVSRYLEKLIPIHFRVELFTAGNLYAKPCKDVLNDFIIEGNEITLDENIKMKDWIYEQLQSRIRLKLDPIDRYENTIYNLPMNLRGIMQLVYLIFNDMEIVGYISRNEQDPFSENFKVKSAKTIIKNLNIYKAHICQTMSETLPVDLSNIVNTWLEFDYSEKNYYICNVLLNEIPLNNRQISGLKNYAQYASHNIAIADVYKALDEYKHAYLLDNVRVYLVYIIKVLYGIELLLYYLQAYLENTDKEEGKEQYNLNIYLTMINAKITPDGFDYMVDDESSEGGQLSAEYKPEAIDFELFKRLLYSNVTSESDFRRSLPNFYDSSIKSNARVNSKNYNIWRYSYLYNFEIEEKDLTKNKKYPIDPYSAVVQKEYVKHSFSCNSYVFYSLFDIDAFVQFRYVTGSRKGFEYFIEHVDHILSRPSGSNTDFIRDSHERNLWKAMSDNLFYKGDRDSVFKEAFEKVDERYLEECQKKGAIGLQDICVLKNRITEAKVEDVSKLNKKEFLNLLDNILRSEKLGAEDKEHISAIQIRLQASRYTVHKDERIFVQAIIEKYDIIILYKDISDNHD